MHAALPIATRRSTTRGLPTAAATPVIQEPDGNVTRCGYVREVAPPRPRRRTSLRCRNPCRNAGAHIIVAVIMGVLGVAIALDWLAFVLFVSRNDPDPNLATAFIFRVAASAAYGAAVVWLWRRR